MAGTLFAGITPTATLWVAVNGSDSNSGTQNAPLRSIQEAIDRAKPGTAIMVTAGTYTENVEFKGVQGTATAPIWLVSADGPQAAVIQAATHMRSVITAISEDNLVIRNFRIEGGLNGIQFGGADATDTAKNVLIEGNHIYGSMMDGVKIHQAANVHVTGNTIAGAADQGIDFVAVQDSLIAKNFISDITGPAAIFMKSGSTNIEVTGNWVRDVERDGISVGGWGSTSTSMEGTYDWEARFVTVSGNIVENVGQRPLVVLGGQDATIAGNYLETSSSYYTAVQVSTGGPDRATPVYSKNVLIAGNTFDRADKLYSVADGNGAGFSFTGNATDGVLRFAAGPDGGVNFTELATVDVAGLGAGQTLKGTANADTLNGGSGHDMIVGGKGHDTINGQGGNDDIYGGDGNDTLSGGTGNDRMFGDDGDDVISGDDGSDFLIGRSGHDRLIGGAGRDTLMGSEGNDVMIGGTSAGIDDFAADDFDGGDGEDVVFAFAGDSAIGGGGFDTLHLNLATQAGKLSLNTTTAFSAAGGDFSGFETFNLQLGSGDDHVQAGGSTLKGANTFLGGAGTDTLVLTFNSAKAGVTQSVSGGKTVWTDGALSVTTDFEVFELTGSKFDDVLSGGARADKISGGDGNDRLAGGAGNDVLIGGNGNDILNGGEGRDRLSGSAGLDRFEFSAVSHSNGAAWDTITDFDFLNDRMSFGAGVQRFDGYFQGGTLSAATFEASLASLAQNKLSAGGVAVFRALNGDMKNTWFVVADGNGVAGYQAGQDFVVQLLKPLNLASMGLPDFI